MHIVIIGNGVSGVTAARFIRKLSDHQITIISSESKHFYSRTALMYIYMGHMRFEDTKPYEDWFWEKNRINLIQDHVTSIDTSKHQVLLKTQNKALAYDRLIIATGSKSNKFGWPGQDLHAVSGLYHLQDLKTMEAYSQGLQKAVIVGGGLIGIEMAEMFHSRDIPVSMLVRESSYWNNVLPPEESAMISSHIKDHHIDLRLGVNLQEIHDNGNGRASGVTIKETGERLDCGFVGLTAGVSPNIGFLAGSAIKTEKGILVDHNLQTNIDGVYAIGDCAQISTPKPGRRPVEAIWYTGRMMGETVAYNICGHNISYEPGIWFNSAKFLDIEYQVYGRVLNKQAEDQESLYWEHPDGTKAIRINYLKASGQVDGFNLMGIRFRHEVCEKWIAQGTKIESVLKNLALANFDPEFYPSYEQEIAELYKNKTGISIMPEQSRKLDRVLSFLRKS